MRCINFTTYPSQIYQGTVISMDRVSMCWIQNETVVNEKKEIETAKPVESQDKSEEKNEHEEADDIDLKVVRSKDIRIHAELKKDNISEETKDEKLDDYDQKENRSANTLLDVSFKIKKGAVMPVTPDNAYVCVCFFKGIILVLCCHLITISRVPCEG